MDPLSIIASSIAIFDGLKEAWRFAEDVIKADSERSEFLQRLECVATVKESLDECLAVEKLHPGQAWVKRLDPDQNKNSPLIGLQETVKKMIETLKVKETRFRQKLKNFKWHSEKGDLEKYFNAIDGYYNRIMAVLDTANIAISRDTNTSMNTLMTEFRLERDTNQKLREAAERKEIERWLSPLDFQATQRHHFESAARTGQWFLNSDEFRWWKEGKFDTLRCYGESGAGKTVLASIAANHLMQNVKSSPVLCLFLEKKPSTTHSVKNLLGSLLKQMIQFRESGINPAIVEMYQKAKRFDIPGPEEPDAQDILQKEMATLDSVYVIVDALDETSLDIRIWVETKLRALASGKMKLLTTTRPDEVRTNELIYCNTCEEENSNKYLSFFYHCTQCPQDIRRRVDLCQSCKEKGEACPRDSSHELRPKESVDMTIYTPEEDLKLYVSATIQDQMPPKDQDTSLAMRVGSRLGYECRQDPTLFEEIVSAIAKNVDGRFLLAKQYTKSLSSKMTRKKIRKAVADMEKGRYNLSDMIDKMYEEDMNSRILAQQDEERKTALKILSVVARAHRNLTLKELQHALATLEEDEQYEEYDPEGELARQTILSVTKGLIRIDRDKEATVRLDHRTLEEYFEKTWKQWFGKAETDLATTCLRYLSFDIFSEPCENVEEFPAKQASRPFVSYALQYWGDHVREAGPEVESAAVAYLKDQSRLDAFIQAAWAADIHEHDRWDVRRTIHPLHICAWFNLPAMIPLLDHSNLDVREKTYGQTPLMYACRRGNESVARYLLSFGADLNLVSGRGRTALTEAVLRGNLEVVELLLDPQLRGLDVHVNEINPLNCNRTALMDAVECGNEEIAIALLKHPRLSINYQDKDGVTALSIAASLGQTKVVKAMLELPDIDLNIRENNMRRTALILAAEGDHWEVVQLLLRHGADATLEDSKGGTAILRAVEEGSFRAFETMLKFRLDLDCTDEDGKGLVHFAAEKGHREILVVLIEKNVPINEPDQIGMTPFHSACKSGEVETASILLENGADVGRRDSHGRSPLEVAWQYGNHEVIDLCKEKGPYEHLVEAPTSEKQLPLWSLVALKHSHLIPEAIAADPSQLSLKEPGTENTALHCAIIDNSDSDEKKKLGVKILQELLSASDHHLDEPDKCQRTPLHLAAVYRNTEAAKVLLEHEPKLDEVDRFGLTPLAIAYTNQKYDLAILLIEAEATIDRSKVGLQTLLFEAIQYQSTRAVKNLIRAGADVLAQDERGQTAFQLAKRIDNGKMLDMVNSMHSFVWQSEKEKKSADGVEITTTELIDGKEAKDIPFRPFQSPKIDLDERAVFEDLKVKSDAKSFPSPQMVETPTFADRKVELDASAFPKVPTTTIVANERELYIDNLEYFVLCII